MRYAYHCTSTPRAARILRDGLMPGGSSLADFTEAEWEQDEIERRYAGASHCSDSRGCICLSPRHEIDERYGYAILRIDLQGLPGRFEYLDGDLWDARTTECAPADAIEIRYHGAIEPARITLVG